MAEASIEISSSDANLTGGNTYVTCNLGGQRVALPMRIVKKVLPVVKLTPLPGAPKYVIGLVNYRGHMLVIVDLRIKLGYPTTQLELSDQFLLISTTSGYIALLTEGGVEVEQLNPVTIDTGATVSNAEPTFRGVSLQPDGLILIHDLTQIFSDDEDRLLSRLLEQGQ